MRFCLIWRHSELVHCMADGAHRTTALQNQVYLQVQHLFKDAPDLLAEFKVFLGEVSGPQSGPVILPQPSGGASPWIPPDNTASSPAVAAKKPQSSKRKKRVMDKEPTPVPQTKPAPPSRVSAFLYAAFRYSSSVNTFGIHRQKRPKHIILLIRGRPPIPLI